MALDLLRSQLHAERDQPPKPHWYLAWNGKHEQTITARDWYDTITHRWGIEPGNRLRKDRRYADLPKARPATSSDHWLMAVQLLEWQLYLARSAVTQKCLPWQPPQAADALTPNKAWRRISRNSEKPPGPLEIDAQTTEKASQTVKERMICRAQVENGKRNPPVLRQALSFLLSKVE